MHYGSNVVARLKLFKSGVDVRDTTLPVNRTFEITSITSRQNLTMQNPIVIVSENQFDRKIYRRFIGYRFEEIITVSTSTYYNTFATYQASAHNDFAKLMEAQKMVDDGYQLLYIPHSDTDSSAFGFGETGGGSSSSSRYGFLCTMSFQDTSPETRVESASVRFVGTEKLDKAYDLAYFTEPANAATNITFDNTTATTVNVNWDEAADTPEAYIVLRKDGTDVTGSPSDGTTYAVGDSIGADTVANVGRDTSFKDTGLTTATTYYYKIFSYNGHGYSEAGSVPNYLTSSALEGNVTTS